MPVYEQQSAAKSNGAPVQREETTPEKKSRPSDLVPEENKAVQRKQEGDPPPAADAGPGGQTAAGVTTAQSGDAAQQGAAKDGGGDAASEEAKKKAAEQQKKEHAAAVTAKWQSLLGDWLGGEMAKVVLENCSLDAFNGYVKDGLKAGGDAINGVLVDQTKPPDAKQVEGVKKFGDALGGMLLPQVEKWMKSPEAQKILGKISSWVEGNPKQVMLVIGSALIGGAVIAWIANPSIDLSSSLNLGGDWKLKAGIDMGKLREMCYQGASLAVQNKSTKIEFKHKVEEKDGDKKQSAEIGASTEQKFGDGSLFKGSSNVTITEETVTVKLNGALTTEIAGQKVTFDGAYENNDGPITGKIKVGEGDNVREFTGTKKGDIVEFSTKQIFAGGSFEQKTSTNTATGKDGHQTTATANVGKGQTVTATGGTEGNKVGYSNSNVAGSGVGVNASAGTNAEGQTELKAGAKYDNGTLKAALDATMLDGKSSMGASVGVSTKEGWKFDASLKVDETRMNELALKMGYRNPDEFRTFLVGYKKSWSEENKDYADHFDVLLEYSIGKWYGRASGGVDIMGNQVKKTNLDLGLGYQVNKDWMLTGGVQANGAMNTANNNAFDMSYKPYLGAQYKGVGVAAYYDTGTKGGGLMLTIPFGR